jgi:RNA polymerase sigma-70 factor (ECF subfamily)
VVEAVKSGDTEAFRLLVDRHKGMLYGVIFKMVGNSQVAEELAQDTFVKAFVGLDHFRGKAKFSTWLVQIGVHATRDHLRRIKRLRQQRIVSLDELRAAQREDLEPVDSHLAANPLSLLGEKEKQDLLQQALGQLPFEHREVLVLKHFVGWSYERIAELTGDSIGTLKVRAHRARQLLKEQMQNLGWQIADGHSC